MLLSDITIFSKYARYLPDQRRRENWDEIAIRNRDMHMARYPALAQEIKRVYCDFVMTKRVLPSMRSMQFGGPPIELANHRIFNCAYMPSDHPTAFSEMMFLLLSGVGVGHSVQRHHVACLTHVRATRGEYVHEIGDSIEGWADAVGALVEAYFYGGRRPVFAYDAIRDKGAPLVTSGGKAPGPEPLRVCLDWLETYLIYSVGKQLTTLNVHDMMCVIADAVLAGGIRRAAMISLFSRDDTDMMTCKSGEWWNDAPWRGRANTSVVLPRNEVGRQEFDDIWRVMKESDAGEPGIYWTNDKDWGTNPCGEISLRPYQFCNLTEVNASNIQDQEEFNDRVQAAAFIGTLQAGYTDFSYLRPVWKETTEEDALIGVGLTGVASSDFLNLNLREAALDVKLTNSKTANQIGINPASRTTTIKPAGTTSMVLGCSSGIHAWHSPYYIRRMRVGKSEALYHYMRQKAPELVEDDQRDLGNAVLSFPQKAPDDAIYRAECTNDFLDRISRFNSEWVRQGHRYGANTHNVSCTVSLQPNEWGMTGEWMWRNRDLYNGITVLPYDGGCYVQTPFEACTSEDYEAMLPHLEGLDLAQIDEETDETNLDAEVACAGGACEMT